MSLPRRSNVSFSKASSSQRSPARRPGGGGGGGENTTDQDANASAAFCNSAKKNGGNNDDNQLPPSVRDYLKEEYEQYVALSEYDRYIQERIHYLNNVLNIACSPSPDEKIVRHNKRKIRLHIYNTHENQKSKNAELDSFSTNEYIHNGLPSWTLKIQGKVYDNKEYNEDVRFTSCFSRIMIITNKETIIWDKRHPDSEECDGLEVVRLGDIEHDIKILFFLDYHIPIFHLSPELAQIVKISEASLPRITRSIWKYAMDNELQCTHDHSLIKTDATLKNLYNGVEQFRLSDLPNLLKSHLFPPKPITFTHSLKLYGDWIDSESTYDIVIDSADIGDVCVLDGSGSNNVASNTLFSSTPSPSSLSLNMLTGEEKIKYEDLQAQINETEKQINSILSKMRQKVSIRSFYTAFSRSPIEFIKSLLTSKHLQPDQPMIDESYMFEYEIADRQSSYYRQPWVNRAISKYLQSSHEPYEDQICQVLLSMQLPDPRKRLKDEEESLTGTGGNVCTSAASRRSRFSADTPNRNRAHVKPKRRIQKDGEK